MIKQLLLITAVFTLTPRCVLAVEDGTFHVYAPSRSSESLLIVKAEPSESGLSLTVANKVDLGFPAATIAAHPEKRLLYVTQLRVETKTARGAVVMLGADGNYSKHVDFTFENGYAYLSLDRENRFLLGADYFGGRVGVYSLDDSGIPVRRVTALDEGRQFAHCVLPSPDNQFVYIPYVKENNALYQYRFDAETGKLTSLEPKNANPPDGTGPRHIAYHPKLPVVYFSNEQHLGISVYKKQEPGLLKLSQVCDAVAKDESTDGISSSDILITPNGRFVFAGIRGHKRNFDRIARYQVKPDGDLKLLGLTESDKIPWGFTLSPDGRYLLVTAFQDGTLTAFRVEQDGNLTNAASLAWDKQISDIVTLAP